VIKTLAQLLHLFDEKLDAQFVQVALIFSGRYEFWCSLHKPRTEFAEGMDKL
jgi:hypothetical protein